MATAGLAALHPFITSSCSSYRFSSKPSPLPPNLHPLLHLPRRRPPRIHQVSAYKVALEHEGVTRTLEVEEDETILGRVLEEGLDVPHDCKLGVCMTCPARLVSGSVDQSEGMLSKDVVERGYALLCVSYPRSDCHVRTIPEDELLAIQLATAND